VRGKIWGANRHQTVIVFFPSFPSLSLQIYLLENLRRRKEGDKKYNITTLNHSKFV
jgi:hypothetical protein